MEGGSNLGAGAKSQLTSSGGFRQTFGGSINEAHLDEAAANLSSQTKQSNQQSSVLGQEGAQKEAAATQGADQTDLAQTPDKVAAQARSVAGLNQELIKRPVVDVIDTFKAMFDPDRLLNIQTKTPEEQAKQKKVAARWQKLTEAEQSEARRLYEESLNKKRQEQELEEQKKQEEEEAKAEELPVPQGRQTGFRGVAGMSGSKKSQTILQRQRTTMTGAE
jgi:hypothetical protein